MSKLIQQMVFFGSSAVLMNMHVAEQIKARADFAVLQCHLVSISPPHWLVQCKATMG